MKNLLRVWLSAPWQAEFSLFCIKFAHRGHLLPSRAVLLDVNLRQTIYNRVVRRILAILIVVLTGLPAITPLFALGGAPDLNRPACCRRDGKHHCMLMDMDESTSSSAETKSVKPAYIGERCPYGSKAMPVTVHPDWTLATASAIFAGVVAHPAVAPQQEAKRRVSTDRSSQKRGPPAISLA